jgi:hypothetical protein
VVALTRPHPSGYQSPTDPEPVHLPHLFKRALVYEGACGYGHGPLTVVELHGRRQGACFTCGCSWYAEGDTIWGCPCVPGDHHCGRKEAE